MTRSLSDILEPSRTAVVLQECQNGIVGTESGLPALAEAARSSGCIDAVVRLVHSARAAGARVIHSVFHQRADGWGGNTALELFRVVDEAPVKMRPGSAAVAVLDEIGVEPADFTIVRHHGVSPFPLSELDSVLRNEGVT
ncbi:MAG: isochorismatase family protein, partial [bacterium]|nr:isochorismatase family protein [bacterium]